MGLAHSPRIVTNGLVLCLDAGNTKSYPGSGTTWTDISRNGNNGTLTNGPTFSSANKGAIVCDGTDDYIVLPTSASLNFTTGDFAFDCWFLTDVIANSLTIFGIPTNTTLQNRNVGAFLDYYNSQTSQNHPLTDNLLTSTWYNVVITRTNGTIKGFLNKDLKFTLLSNNATHNFSGTGIGRRTISPLGFYWDGQIAVVRIYNAGLSDSQVEQNFNATRGRFGI